MGAGETPEKDEEPDEVGQLLRTRIRPYAILIILLGAGFGGWVAVEAVRFARHAYERYPAEGLSDGVAWEGLKALFALSAALAGWKSVSNGWRMFNTTLAARGDRKQALDPLTRYRSSERVDSPTLRFVSLVLPVFFSGTYILGTLAILQKKAPIGPAVLPHYGSMFFLGLMFLTYSATRSGPGGSAEFRKSRLHGFLLRTAALWAGLLGWWMIVDALVLATRLGDAPGAWRWFCFLLPQVFLYLGFAVQGAAKTLLRHSRRHLARVIRSPAELERQTYVLYLRTFRSDTLQAGIVRGGPAASGRSEEEQVAIAFNGIGPLVAVGRPGESLPFVGAIRMYLPLEDWQTPVRELMSRARMVVIVLGPGEGTMWEVREALRLLPPERLVLLVPADEDNYEPFRSAVLKAGGGRVVLPPHPGAGRMPTELQAVISFAPGWKPVLRSFDESPFRPSSYRNPLTTALKFQLRPVFTGLAQHEQRRPG